MRSFSLLLLAASVVGQPLFAQEVANTRAQPNDWEEINFETNQAVMVDGFPSLLRLAELLKTHPDYKATIVGYADQRGSNRLNDALSLRRANAVSQFLQKYGASGGQLHARGEGKKNPEDQAANRNAHFVNRRVSITVTAPNGTVIGDGSITSAIDEFITYSRGQLGKLDGILAQLQQLEAQVQALNTADIKQDTTAIRQDTASIKQDTGTLVQRPAPLTAEQTTQIANTAGREAADYALRESALRNRKYSLIGFGVGPTFGPGRVGDYSAEVIGKALIPFGNGKTPEEPGTHGFVVDGSWTYAHPNTRLRNGAVQLSGLSDGVFNTGLVNRFGHAQLGTFAQFDYASLTLSQAVGTSGSAVFSHGGTLLAGGVVTFDFVMPGGTIGVFGAKGLKETGNINTTAVTPLTTPAYLRYADQAGFSAAGTFRGFQVESSVAWVKQYIRGFEAMPASSLKISFGPSDKMQFYIEGDSNTTFANAVYPAERLVFGVQFGNWVRARNYGSTQAVVPTMIPRPHYELLTR
ncbi:MAG: OmpA family protein [Acidobacteriota bacterium]|nr:OmpA family protein [Acidobacteriota bacterium]